MCFSPLQQQLKGPLRKKFSLFTSAFYILWMRISCGWLLVKLHSVWRWCIGTGSSLVFWDYLTVTFIEITLCVALGLIQIHVLFLKVNDVNCSTNFYTILTMELDLQKLKVLENLKQSTVRILTTLENTNLKLLILIFSSVGYSAYPWYLWWLVKRVRLYQNTTNNVFVCGLCCHTRHKN